MVLTAEHGGTLGDRVDLSVRALTGLPCPPSPPFLFMHHPNQWECMVLDVEKGEAVPDRATAVPAEDGTLTGDYVLWAPVLSVFSIDPGVGGVRAGPGGHLSARASREAEGWRFVPPDADVWVSGPGGLELTQGYLRRRRTMGGKWVHSDVWARPVVLGVGTQASVDWRTEYDVQGRDATRELWLSQGLLHALSPAAAAQRIKLQRQRVQRRVRFSSLHPGLAGVAAFEQVRLSGMIAGAPSTPGAGRVGDARRRVLVPDAEEASAAVADGEAVYDPAPEADHA